MQSHTTEYGLCVCIENGSAIKRCCSNEPSANNLVEIMFVNIYAPRRSSCSIQTNLWSAKNYLQCNQPGFFFSFICICCFFQNGNTRKSFAGNTKSFKKVKLNSTKRDGKNRANIVIICKNTRHMPPDNNLLETGRVVAWDVLMCVCECVRCFPLYSFYRVFHLLSFLVFSETF